MLCEFPQDILREVIANYLHPDLHQLSTLDVAFCNRARRSDLLAVLGAVQTSTDVIKHTTSQSLKAYLDWVISRGVQSPKLSISLSAFNHASLTFNQPIRGVQCIELISTMAAISSECFGLVVGFLNQFASLQVLGCWKTITSDQLLGLQDLRCQLHGLDFLACSFSDKKCLAAVAALAASLGDHLQVLLCHGLDAEALTAITQHCHNMTVLDMNSLRKETFDAIVQLCAANALTLRSLTLKGLASKDTIMQIAAACPALEILSCTMMSGHLHALPTVLFILDRCLKIRTVKVATNIGIGIAQDSQGNRLTEISGANDYQLIELASKLSIPVRACQVYLMQDPPKGAAVLAGKFRDNLESLQLQTVGDSGNDDDTPVAEEVFHPFTDLFKDCPNLTDLTFSHRSLVPIVCVPALCPKLRKLAIQNSNEEAFSAADLLPLFEQFKAYPNQVTDFALPGNTAFDSVMLTAMAEAFPCLHAFTVTSVLRGSVQKHQELLLDLILAGKLKAKRITTLLPSATWLSEQLRHHGIHNQLQGKCVLVQVK